MTTPLEQSLVRSLRLILEPLPDQSVISDSDEFRKVCSYLESYIPAIIREVHPESETLDGVMATIARKTGPGAALLAGHCILIEDQTVTPFHLQIQIAHDIEEVSWLECRFGQASPLSPETASMIAEEELIDRRLVRVPYGDESVKKILEVVDEPDALDWFYRVTFGEKR
jgi:hypothetical protein